MTQVYISCPLGVPMEKLREVGSKLTKMGYSSWWFERGTTYDENKLKLAPIFVLMSEGNRFDYCLDDMTPGCRKEIALAKSLGKTLYMAYWKKEKELNIYPISLKHLEDGRVLGQSGVYLREADKVINDYSIY